MKTVKVWYCDFFRGFNFNVILGSSLKNKFNIILDKKNPDIVFYSVFGNKHYKYLDKILIFFTAEAIAPDFNICDYAIGFDRLEFNDRYLRYPNYKLHLSNIKHLNSIERGTNRKFCCFVVSNRHAIPERKRMFDLLNNYKHVDSGGRFLNNIGYRVKDKHKFLSEYKFCLCFENCIYDGYTTEKIVEAFAAGCIPIYLGNPSIAKEFNPNSFVNCSDFSSLEEACEYVKKIDNDVNLYNKIIRNIKINKEIVDEKPLEDFLVHIFSQDFAKAKRAPHKTKTWWRVTKPRIESIKAERKTKQAYLLRRPVKFISEKIKHIFNRDI